MKLINVIKEQSSNSGYCKWVLQWQEASIFGEFINRHENAIGCTRLGNTLNEINRNDLPCLLWDQQGLKQPR
jgi:hypothetical protein